jgi:hypothetical protein
MKKKVIIILLAVASIISCTTERTESNLLTIDVTRDYPSKEMKLSEVAEVSYLQLNADDPDYLFRARIYTITQKYVIIGDADWNVLFFDRKDGRPVAKYNRRGNGPGEYLMIYRSAYDDVNNELYITEFSDSNIRVFASDGTYKRTLKLPKGTDVSSFYVFNDSSLLLYDESRQQEESRRRAMGGEYIDNLYDEDRFRLPFVLINKNDGSLISYITVPETHDIDLAGTMRPGSDRPPIRIMASNRTRLIPYNDGFIVANPEADTVFSYTRAGKLTPEMVQTPPVLTLSPKRFISSYVETGGHRFLNIYTTTNLDTFSLNMPYVNVAVNMETGEIYMPIIEMDDYQGKKIELSPNITFGVTASHLGFVNLNLEELKQANSENKLSGRLKEIVESSAEDDNDVLCLIHFTL